MANLHSAHYVTWFWVSTRLKNPLPLRALDLQNESKLSFIEKMSKETAIILMLLEIEGLRANVKGLRAFVQQYQQLEFTLVIGESEEQ